MMHSLHLSSQQRWPLRYAGSRRHGWKRQILSQRTKASATSRDEATVRRYEVLAASLEKLSQAELNVAVHNDEVSTSLDFLGWLSEKSEHSDASKTLHELGGRIMAIREGYGREPLFWSSGGYCALDLEEGGVSDAKSIGRTLEESDAGLVLLSSTETALVNRQIEELSHDLKSSKDRSTRALLGRKKVSNQFNPLDTAASVPDRIVEYLLSLEDEEDLQKGVAEAIVPPGEQHLTEDADLEYLSATPIQLLAAIQRLKSSYAQLKPDQRVDASFTSEKLNRLSALLRLYLSSS